MDCAFSSVGCKFFLRQFFFHLFFLIYNDMDESSGKTRTLEHLPLFVCCNQWRIISAFVLMQLEELMLQSQRKVF